MKKIKILFAFLLLIVLSCVTITIANNSFAESPEEHLTKRLLLLDTCILDLISFDFNRG